MCCDEGRQYEFDVGLNDADKILRSHSIAQAGSLSQVIGGPGLFDRVTQRAAIQLGVIGGVGRPDVVAALSAWEQS